MKARRLILIRHAHRDTSDRAADNGLSPKGRRQVRKLLEYWKKNGVAPGPVRMLSSPKRRCVETIEPLAENSGVEITIEPALMEQQDAESAVRFDARILELLRRCAQGKDGASVTVLCSHGDWLPRALSLACLAPALPGGTGTPATFARLKKCGVAELVVIESAAERPPGGAKGSLCELRWLLQSPAP